MFPEFGPSGFGWALLAAGSPTRSVHAVDSLIDALVGVADSVALLAGVLSGLVWPWLPLIVWGGFWLVLVDWRSLLVLLHRVAGGLPSSSPQEFLWRRGCSWKWAAL